MTSNYDDVFTSVMPHSISNGDDSQRIIVEKMSNRQDSNLSRNESEPISATLPPQLSISRDNSPVGESQFKYIIQPQTMTHHSKHIHNSNYKEASPFKISQETSNLKNKLNTWQRLTNQLPDKKNTMLSSQYNNNGRSFKTIMENHSDEEGFKSNTLLRKNTTSMSGKNSPNSVININHNTVRQQVSPQPTISKPLSFG